MAGGHGYLSAKEASKLFETQPKPGTVLKWMRRGIHDKRIPNTTNRIKLKSICEGAFPMTRIEWVIEFKAACAANVKDVSK